jgi:carbonic anhydrase
MALLDDVLAANSALVDGSDVPVPPVAEGRRIVIVTCSEIRAPSGRDIAKYFGLAAGDVFVVANSGARVHDPSGDVVRSVAVALAQAGGGEVFVVAHENCSFLHADADSLNALLPAPNSSTLGAAEALCGENFISARKLAITSAENLRASPFVAAGAAVHAMMFAEGRGRLTSEQSGYGVSSAAPSAAPIAMGMSFSPSPILTAPGGVGGFATGPVSLLGSGPSALMGAPASLMGASSPDFGGSPAAFLAPTPPNFNLPPAPPSFGAPSPPLSFGASKSPPPASEPPPLDPVTFVDVPPPPPSPRRSASGVKTGTPRPPDLDDPFRRAAETLERLRRERRK